MGAAALGNGNAGSVFMRAEVEAAAGAGVGAGGGGVATFPNVKSSKSVSAAPVVAGKLTRLTAERAAFPEGVGESPNPSSSALAADLAGATAGRRPAPADA